MNNEDLISIIIPIYNIEAYVERCIKSIINQTYKKIEIILVDDGSTDGSSNICDKYSKIDQRIVSIHKKNGGLSDARNAGIDIAKGEYYFFLDGDDYISKDCIKYLYGLITSNNSEISTTGYVQFKEGQHPKSVNGKDKTYNTVKALEQLLYQKNVTNSAWGKLYNRHLFDDNLRYPKGKICEDLPTTYRLFAKANKITISSSKRYFYQQRSNSIINSEFKPERMDAISFAKDETNFIINNYPKIKKAAINREFMELVYIYNCIGNNKKNKNNHIKNKLKKEMSRYRLIVIFDIKSKLLPKLYALLGVELVKKIRKII